METIETTNSNKIDWYEVVDNTVKETTTDYFTEIYSPWETKKQLIVWQEVATPKSVSWTIDTTDLTIETVWNTYTLSVDNPDWKIFSLWVDWVTKTFKIWYFWNTALAYAQLETELIAWLTAYDVEFDNWTDFNISRKDWQELSITHPNLTRTITLSWFDTISIVDVIVDWVTVQLAWVTHSWNENTAITYLKSQLSSTLYYMNDDSAVLTIARKDWEIPVITKTQYNLYTYAISYKYDDLSRVTWDYTNSIIDSITYTTPWTDRLVFRWDKIIRNLGWYVMTENYTYDTSNWWWTTPSWRNITTYVDGILTTVEKSNLCTATRCILKQWATTIATVNFVWNVATFNEDIDKNLTYSILVDNNWAAYINDYDTSPSPAQTNDYFTLEITSTVYAITEVNVQYRNPTWYTLSTRFNTDTWYDTTWTLWNEINYYNLYHYLYINKTDYSAITFTSTNYYDSGSDWTYTDFQTTNHLADITIATPTEITITLTLLSNSYFIPVPLKIKKIVMNAVSSWWSSEWIYELREQSCTTSWVTVVADKIFKTDTTNYWNIVLIKKAWFIINWTTDKKNILTYTCT